MNVISMSKDSCCCWVIRVKIVITTVPSSGLPEVRVADITPVARPCRQLLEMRSSEIRRTRE